MSMVKLFFGAFRQAVREKRSVEKQLVESRTAIAELQAENKHLVDKYEKQTALLLERDFRWADRFLTATVKTYAIHDEVKEALKPITQKDQDDTDWENFRADKIEFLIDCLKEAGDADPERRAVSDFDNNLALYQEEFNAETVR